MKKHYKLNLLAILGFCLVTLNGAFAADEGGGVKEEAYTLENIYQAKARATLDTLLNPDDYTLVISATLRNDEAKLKEYHTMIDKKFLPGMTMNDPAGFGEEHNILHSLKQKVEIQLVLSDRVPADRDALVKDILKAKLKLNEESGDSINVVRAAHNIPVYQPNPLAKIYPELSGKMIAFLILMAIIAVTGIALWMYKKHEEELEAARTGPSVYEKELIKEAVKEDKGEETEEEEKQAVVDPNAGKTPEEIEEENRILGEKIEIANDSLMRLTQEYLSIVSRALEEFVAQGNLFEITLFLESIGWDQSRKVFKNIDSKLWGRIANSLRERKEDPTLQQIYQAIHVFQRFALSYVLEKAGSNSENPFAFIFKLSHSQRIDLLQNENTYNIALIAIYCTGAQMGELMSGLDPAKQDEILFNITKIKHLPESEVNNSISQLLARLEHIKKEPSIHVDGLGLAAKFIRSLDPLKEEELYQSIREQHPEEAESLRRTQVMFQDIPYYPNEMIRKVVDALDADDVLKSLVGYPSDFVDSFLGLLPTKKALMIQNDLFHMSDSPAPYQCATARRKITMKIEQELERLKFNIPDYWKLFDQQAVAAEEQPYEEQPVEEQPVAASEEMTTEVDTAKLAESAEPKLQLVEPPAGEEPAKDETKDEDDETKRSA